MPNITHRTYRHKRHHKEYGYKKEKEWDVFYGSRNWKVLRSWYIKSNPICEVCAKEGIFVPAEHIHHLHVFRDGKSQDDKWNLFLDPNNLCAVCGKHHHMFHNYMNKFDKVYASIDELVAYDMNDKIQT